MPTGEIGWEVWVGGGLGRTPMIAKLINGFVPHEHLLAYLESILRVYNRYGRRDNKYKARIKILVHETGSRRIREQVEAEFAEVKGGVLTLPQDELDRITRLLRAAATSSGSTRPRSTSRARRSSIRPTAAGSSNNINSHRAAGLCLGDDLAEADRRRAGRCDLRADGRGRRPRRALFVRRAARDARAEPRAAACQDRRPARGLRRAGRDRSRRGQCRADHRHDHLPGHGLLRAGHCPLDPDRAGDLAHASPRPSGRRKSAISRSRFRAASMPAATTMSATSAFSGVEKKGVELYQITVGGDATENAVGRRYPRPRLRRRGRARRDRAAGRYLSSPAPRERRTSRSSPPSAASAKRRSRRRSMAALDMTVVGARSRPSATSCARSAIMALNGMFDEMDGAGRAAPGGRPAAAASSRSSRRSAPTRRCCCTWWRRSIRACRSISSRPASTLPRRSTMSRR